MITEFGITACYLNRNMSNWLRNRLVSETNIWAQISIRRVSDDQGWVVAYSSGSRQRVIHIISGSKTLSNTRSSLEPFLKLEYRPVVSHVLWLCIKIFHPIYPHRHAVL